MFLESGTGRVRADEEKKGTVDQLLYSPLEMTSFPSLCLLSHTNNEQSVNCGLVLPGYCSKPLVADALLLSLFSLAPN